MDRAGKSTAKFGKGAEKDLKRASGGLRGLGSAAKAAGGLLAGAGVAAGLKDIATAARDAEVVQVRVEKAAKNAGISWAKYGKQIEGAIQAQSKLTGLDDEDLADSFANLARTTGDANKALKLNAVAADIARTKGMSLSSASSLLARVYNGSFTGAKRLGIEIDKNATKQEVLATIQRKFAGQAEAYGRTSAGSFDRLNVATENLKEKLGAALLPALASVATAATRFVNQMENGTGAGGRFAEVARQIGEGLKGVAVAVAPVVRDVARFVGKHPELVKVAGAVVALGLAVKTIRFAGAITGVSSLLTAMGKLGAGPGRQIGQRITDGLIERFGGRRRAIQATMTSTVTSAGSAAGTAGGAATATAAGEAAGSAASQKKLGRAGGRLGRALSKALAVSVAAGVIGVGVALATQINKEFTEALDDLFGGSGSGRDRGHDSLRPSPLNLLKDIAGVGDGPGKGRLKSAVKKAAGGSRAVPTGGGGMNLMGANRSLAGFAQIGANFGLRVSSGRRATGNRSYHNSGDAIDMSNGTRPTPEMLRYAKFLSSRYGSRLSELIYTPLGYSIKDGRKVAPLARSTHNNHVHVAFDEDGSGPASGRRFGGAQGDGPGRYEATSYGPPWNRMNGTGVTANGTDLRPAKKAYGIAVDPKRIRLGSKLYAWPNPFGHRGRFTAFDTGGAIKGDRIDFYDWRGRSAQMRWGRRPVTLSTSAPGKKMSAAATKVSASVLQTAGGSAGGPLIQQGQAGLNAGAASFEASTSGPLSGPIGAPTGASVADVVAQQRTEAANAQIALAALTPQKDDDLAALGTLEGLLSGQLSGAMASGNNSAISEIAGALKGVRDQIAGLKDSVDANTSQIAEARADAERQLKEQSMARERLGQSQYGVLANAIAEVANGVIGGRTGLGFQSVGFAGGGVRY